MSEQRRPEDLPPPPPPNARRFALALAAIVAALLLAAAVGPAIRAGLSKGWGALFPAPDAAGTQGAARYHTCGMHPWVILPKPGTCPICAMDLVPLDPSKFSGEVAINPVVAQNIGVRVEPVTGGASASTIRTVGTVEYDETRLGDVNLKVAGWIEKLHVDHLGARVREGQPLFSLYSPELYAAQEEYLLAYRAQQKAGGDKAAGIAGPLLEAARTKLAYFDIDAGEIRALEKRGTPVKTMTIRSPHGGVVTEKHAVEGMKVVPGMTAYRIADLSRVWVIATLYEYQSQYVKVGQPAKMTLTYLPGQQLAGKVVYVYPYLDQRTRQINVRLEFSNPKLALKPGMYATVVFEGTRAEKRALVPRAAVIDTGERQVAFVSKGQGRFEPREVRMGAETAAGQVEILEGLQPGELVVVSGQFLIDSESRMREALARMVKGTPADAPPPPAASEPAAQTVKLPNPATAALGAALDAYLTIGAALVSDTARDIGVEARKLAEALDLALAVPVADAPAFWEEHPQGAAAKQQAEALAQAGTIDAARRGFAKLSAELAALLKATGVPRGYAKPLVEAHCPMYPPGDAKGAVWIQAAGPVRNPYFGKVMLTCADRTQALAGGR